LLVFLHFHFTFPKRSKLLLSARVIYHRIALHYLFIFKHMSPQVLISLFSFSVIVVVFTFSMATEASLR